MERSTGGSWIFAEAEGTAGAGAGAGAGADADAGGGLAGGAPAAGLAAGAAGLFSGPPKFSSGGVGTAEIHNATLFEDNKAEAVIPLETRAGVEYLANAMTEALSLIDKAGAGNSNPVNINIGMLYGDERSKNEFAADMGQRIANIERKNGGF